MSLNSPVCDAVSAKKLKSELHLWQNQSRFSRPDKIIGLGKANLALSCVFCVKKTQKVGLACIICSFICNWLIKMNYIYAWESSFFAFQRGAWQETFEKQSHRRPYHNCFHSRVLPMKSKLIFMCRISELPPFKPQISSMASNWKWGESLQVNYRLDTQRCCNYWFYTCTLIRKRTDLLMALGSWFRKHFSLFAS